MDITRVAGPVTRYPGPVPSFLPGSSLFGAFVIDAFLWVAAVLGEAPGRLGAVAARVEATVVEWGWSGPTGELAGRIAYTPARIALALFLVMTVVAVAALVSSVLTRRSR